MLLMSPNPTYNFTRVTFLERILKKKKEKKKASEHFDGVVDLFFFSSSVPIALSIFYVH